MFHGVVFASATPKGVWIGLAIACGVGGVINGIAWMRCRSRARNSNYRCRVSASRHFFGSAGALALMILWMVRAATV